MGRADESIASYRNQVEIDPRNRYATSNLSRALASRGQWEEALPLAAVAAEVMPEDVKRWHFLGRTQIKTGHIGKAMVEEHEVIGTVTEHDQGIGGGAAAGHLMAGALKPVADEHGDVVVILDEKEL